MNLETVKKCNSIWLVTTSVCVWLYVILFDVFVHPTFSKMMYDAKVTQWTYNNIIGNFIVKYAIIIACVWGYYFYNNSKLRKGTGGNAKVSLVISSVLFLSGILWLASTMATTIQTAVAIPYVYVQEDLVEKRIRKKIQAEQAQSAKPEMKPEESKGSLPKK